MQEREGEGGDEELVAIKQSQPSMELLLHCEHSSISSVWVFLIYL